MDEVKALICEELNRANEKFPQFHSAHEAWAVLLEEIEEAQAEANSLLEEASELWTIIKANDLYAYSKKIDYIKQVAISLITEAIQVGAMALKFQHYLDKENASKTRQNGV